MNTDNLSLTLSRINGKPFVKKQRKFKSENHTDHSWYSIKDTPMQKKEDDDVFNFLEETKKPKFTKLDPNCVYGTYNAPKAGTPDKLPLPTRKYSGKISGLASDKESSQEKDSLESKSVSKETEKCEIFEFLQPLKPFNLELEGCDYSDMDNDFIEKSKINSIDIIRLRAFFGYYHNIQQLYDDVMYLLKYTLSERCKNLYANYYLSEMIYLVQALFRDKERNEMFCKMYKTDLEYRFNMNGGLKVHGKWNKVIGAQRKYISVDDYIPVVNDDNTLDRIKTSKTSICKGGC